MARTADEIYDHLLRLSPSWFREPEKNNEAVLRAWSETFALFEAALDTMHFRTQYALADGAWLDLLGAERGVTRMTGESDDDYRARLRSIEDKVTRPAILAAVDAALKVGTARMEEWLPDGAFSDIQDRRGFSDTAVAHSELRGFTIYIQEQFASRSDRAYALDDPANPFQTAGGTIYLFAGDPADTAFAGIAFAEGSDPTPSGLYSEIYRLIDRLRAGGLGPAPHFEVRFE